MLGTLKWPDNRLEKITLQFFPNETSASNIHFSGGVQMNRIKQEW